MLVPCTLLSTFLPVILPITGLAPAPAYAVHHMKRRHPPAQPGSGGHFSPLFDNTHFSHSSSSDNNNNGGDDNDNGIDGDSNTDEHAEASRKGKMQQQHNHDASLDSSSSSSSGGGGGGGGSNVPLVVTNQCREDIYPGILSQAGVGPDVTGFALQPGEQKKQSVSHDWQGRVWGRTNCSFNAAGTMAADGSGVACKTGDCGGTVKCLGTGVIPVTLAEFTLNAHGQTFYDISLVDGYNLPMGVVSLYPASGNSTLEAIPPNLTNPVCIGTASELAPPGDSSDATLGTNASFPLPLEESLTAAEVAQWCPWNLQLDVPTGPRGGVYTYPEASALQRQAFCPCYSQCAKTGQPQDCCTGKYQSPSACKPSIYSADAKMVCPDAYSYAFDDQTSTFIIPAGGGFEVIFCPPGRSTTILSTYKQQLSELAQGGLVVSTTDSKARKREGTEKRNDDDDDDDDEDDDEEVTYAVDGISFRGTRLRHPSARFERGRLRRHDEL